MFRLLTALVLFLIPGSLFAATCAIESGPGPELAKYLADVSRVVATASAAARSGTCGIGNSGNAATSIERYIDTSIAAANRARTPDSSEASIRYYGELTLGGGIPPVFKRDIQAVESLDRKIQRAYESSAKNCGLFISVDLVPLGELSLTVTGSVNAIFSDLITTNSIILDHMRSAPSIGDMGWTLSSSERMKTSNTSALIGEIKANYDDDKSIDACQKISEANEKSFKVVGTSFKDAFDFSKGKKAWSDAIQMMRNLGDAAFGKRDAGYREKERQLLARELARQGVSSNQSARIMKSIDASSTSYGGAITDTLSNIETFATDFVQQFAEAYDQAIGPLKELYTETSDAFTQKAISTSRLPQILENQADLRGLQTALIAQYVAMNQRMDVVNENATDTTAALVSMHVGLIQSTNYIK